MKKDMKKDMKNIGLSALMAGVAALTIVSPTQAQSPAAPGPDDAEPERLRADIRALQARLDAVEAQAATPAPVAPPSDRADSTKIGGRIYFNLSHIDQQSDGADNSQNGLQTDVKRFYVTLDHTFDKTLSANITTDFRYNSGGTDKDVLLYVKKAYVQATLAPEFVIRVGSADMPWVPFVENIYGYRFVENVVVDRMKYGTSADWGVHISGRFANGLVSYAVSAVNGAGYKTLARNSDTIDLEGRISVQPVKNLFLAVGGYTGKLGKGSAINTTPHRATRVNALVGYTGERLRGGVEYFTATNWNNVTTDFEDKTTGWSVFGSYAVTPKITLFGRYDWVNPDRKTNPALDDDYFNAGVHFQPMKDVDLALVYKRERVDNGLVRTSNGTIGGADSGRYDEVGLWAQFRF